MRKNRILLLSIILCTSYLVEERGGTISYLLFYFTLLIPCLSIIYVCIVYNYFCVFQHVNNKVFIKKERIPYELQLSNDGILSFTKINVHFMKDYYDIENMDQTTQYCLLPREKIHKNTTICCQYRGTYKIGIDHITIRDYLNLFQFTYSCKSAIEVKVLPRVLHLSSLSFEPDLQDYKKQQYHIDMKQEIPDVEVRQYQPSDMPKKIHWKATARQGELLTRRYSEEPKPQMHILLDLNISEVKENTRLYIEDKIIEVALAIVDYYIRNHITVTVLFDRKGFNKFQISNQDGFNYFYQFCSQVKFNSTLTTETLLKYSMNYNSKKQYSLLITAKHTEELLHAADQYCALDNRLHIIYVGDKSINSGVHGIIERYHIHQIDSSHEVQEVLERASL